MSRDLAARHPAAAPAPARPATRLLAISLALMAATAPGVRAADAPTPATWTADALVARNVQARGGEAALRALHSLRRTGRLLVNDGQFQLAFTETIARPGWIREEASVQGLTQVQAWDGHEAWQINPFDGRKDPERLPADNAKPLAEAAQDFDGPLFDWRAKGARLEYLGLDDVDGTLAHKLRLVRANGDVETVWLDPDHFLEIRTLSQRTEQGTKVEVVSDLGDYEQVAGVWIPMSVESGRKGSQERQKTLYRKAEANVAVDAATFRFPAGAPASPVPPRPPASAASVPATR